VNRFIRQKNVAKMGFRFPIRDTHQLYNQSFPAISDSYSLLLEVYMNLTSVCPAAYGYCPMVLFHRSDWTSFFYIQNNVSAINFGVNAPDGAEIISIDISNDMYKLDHFAFLLDRINNLRKAYVNGELKANPALTKHPSWNASNRIYFGPQGQYINWDGSYLLTRFTTLSSVPSNIDDIIKWQWQNPMKGIHKGLIPCLGGIQSTWTFDNPGYGTGDFTTIRDEGYYGNIYPISTSIDTKSWLQLQGLP